ncbi:MAG: glycosyltransferase family 2 protein [Planctomycetota bacterium]
MISIVIPAHNEERVIGRCLRGVTERADPGELEIIVVCNGCSDRTADVARAFSGDVKVLETEVASKSHALNLGDSAALGFPRFYIDADVAVSLPAVRKVAEVLRGGRILAAAPRMRVALEGVAWAVRAYYRIWMRLPYHAGGMIGSGFYALSEEGRRRFTSFPNVISDDGFVRLHFAPHERVTVEGCCFQITAPRSLWGVIKVKTRSQFGAYQLRRAFSELLVNDPRRYGGVLAGLLARPWLWPSLAVYCLVLYVARARTLWRFLTSRHSVWDRDESSRASGEGRRTIESSVR